MNIFLAFLAQLIVYSLLMLYNEYAGHLLAFILGTVFLAIFLISLLVELIEPSRVNRAYYGYMVSGWLAPALAFAGFVLLRGEIAWLQ